MHIQSMKENGLPPTISSPKSFERKMDWEEIKPKTFGVLSLAQQKKFPFICVSANSFRRHTQTQKKKGYTEKKSLWNCIPSSFAWNCQNYTRKWGKNTAFGIWAIAFGNKLC